MLSTGRMLQKSNGRHPRRPLRRGGIGMPASSISGFRPLPGGPVVGVHSLGQGVPGCNAGAAQKRNK